MSESPSQDRVTRLLNEADERPQAAEELLPLVYDQLRAAAQVHMGEQRRGHTLQATALVHEAYMKLVGGDSAIPWANRRHFYSVAADAMRQVLIDHARTRSRSKRGGGRARVELATIDDFAEADSSEILRFDELLCRLEGESPDHAAVVRLRFYAGLTVDQTAEALGVSTSTVDRRWVLARAWLFRELGRVDAE